MTGDATDVADGLVPVTVTYLETTGGAARLPPAPARPNGAAWQLLAPCPVALYADLYDGVGRPWHWLERKRMSEAALSAILANPAVEVMHLLCDGRSAGYAEIDSRRLKDEARVELAYFGIRPDFIGRGLGPWLLHEALLRAWSKGPHKITVNTCTLDHPAALALYRRMGFVPIATRQIRFDTRWP